MFEILPYNEIETSFQNQSKGSLSYDNQTTN